MGPPWRIDPRTHRTMSGCSIMELHFLPCYFTDWRCNHVHPLIYNGSLWRVFVDFMLIFNLFSFISMLLLVELRLKHAFMGTHQLSGLCVEDSRSYVVAVVWLKLAVDGWQCSGLNPLPSASTLRHDYPVGVLTPLLWLTASNNQVFQASPCCLQSAPAASSSRV